METNLLSDSKDCSKNKHIISQLITQKDIEGVRLIDRINTQWLIFQLDRIKLEFIEAYCPSDGVDIVDFTRMFLRVIPHKQEEIIYTTMAILQLYQEIISIYCVKKVTFKNITDHLCQRILFEKTDSNEVKTRLLPRQKTIKPVCGVREIQIQAPVIYGENQQLKARISLKRLKSDRYKHSGRIRNCFYSKTSKQIYALSSLSDFIGVYDLDCTLVDRITPSSKNFKKDINILHFAYSQRQERIGAVLKDYSMVFWDIGMKWQGEKNFSVTNHCSEYQSSIWFMESHNMWLTSDSSGVLYSWDISQELPITKTILQNKSKITDLCELPCLGLIALAQQHRVHQGLRRSESIPSKIVIYDLHKNLRVSEFSVSYHGVHTLHFCNTYQVLLAASFDMMIHLLEVNPVYFDITLKGVLIGHQSIVSTFLPIQDSPILISSDDKGNIKLWDIRNYKCLQTISMGEQVLINRFVDMSNINKLCFTGSRISIIDFDAKQTNFRASDAQYSLHPIHVQSQGSKNELLVFTKKDMRVYNLKTGTVKQIYSGLFEPEDELLTAKYVPSKNNLIIVSDQSKLKMCSMFNGNLSEDMQKTQSSVTCVAYDIQNNLLVSGGDDSNIVIQKRMGTNKMIEVRRFSDNFYCKQITTMELSSYHSLLAISNASQGSIFIWDYQMGKLLGGVQLENNLEPVCLSFVNGYSLLVIGCSNGEFYVLKFESKQGILEFELILKFDFLPQDKGDTLVKQMMDLRVQAEEILLCELVVATKSGVVYEFDLTDELSKMNLTLSERRRYYHMPQTLLRESFNSQISKKKFSLYNVKPQRCRLKLSVNNIKRFQAHREAISSINFIEQTNRYRVTASNDGRVMIWKRAGILVCDLNINLPLPYKWQLGEGDDSKSESRLLLALRVIKCMLARYVNTMEQTESELINVNTYLQKIQLNGEDQNAIENICPKVRVLQDEFSKKDLHYDTMKKSNFSQVRGPSLRQMKFERRLKILQNEKRKRDSNKAYDNEPDKSSEQLDTQADNKMIQREELLEFLLPSRQSAMEPEHLYTKNNSAILNTKYVRHSYEQTITKTQPHQKVINSSNRSAVRKQNKSQLFEDYYLKKKTGNCNTNPCPSLWQGRDNSEPTKMRKHHKQFGSILKNLSRDLDNSKKKTIKLAQLQSTWNSSKVSSHKVFITAPDLTSNRKLYRRTCRKFQM